MTSAENSQGEQLLSGGILVLNYFLITSLSLSLAKVKRLIQQVLIRGCQTFSPLFFSHLALLKIFVQGQESKRR